MYKRFLLLLVAIFFVIRIPFLIAAYLNNMASLTLRNEWPEFYLDANISHCGINNDGFIAGRYTALALRLSPSYERVLVHDGMAAYLSGDCSSALIRWVSALQINPQDQITELWQFWVQGGQSDQLPAIFEKKKISDLVWYWGRYAEDNARQEASIIWYQYSFDMYPRRMSADKLINNDIGNTQKNLAIWNKVMETRQLADEEYWWAKGQIYQIQGLWEEAASTYAIGSEIALLPYDFWMQQGNALEQMQLFDNAEKIYEKAYTSRPDLLPATVKLAYRRFYVHDYTSALEWYRRAAAIAPEQAGINYYLGLTYYYLGNDQSAEEALQKAILLGQDKSTVDYFLAQILYRTGRTEGAIAYLTSAIELNVDKKPWDWAIQLGDWKLSIQDKDGAITAYQQALEWHPGMKNIEDRITNLTSP